MLRIHDIAAGSGATAIDFTPWTTFSFQQKCRGHHEHRPLRQIFSSANPCGSWRQGRPGAVLSDDDEPWRSYKGIVSRILLSFIGDAPHGAVTVFGDQERTVVRHGDAYRSTPHVTVVD